MKVQALLTVALGAVVSAQTITVTGGSDALSSKISSSISSYESSVYGGLPVSVATQVQFFITSVGGAWLGNNRGSYGEYTSSINAMITGTPDYLSGAPSTVSSLFKSVATAEASIINKANGAASLGGDAVKVAAVAAAGAVAGAVAFML